MKTQKFRIIPITLGVLWLAALIFATMYDLDISLAIADENSLFGRALEIFGEPPAILFTSFNFSLMLAHFMKKPNRSVRDFVLAALVLICAVGAVIFTVNSVANYLSLSDDGFFTVVLPISALIAFAIISLAMRLPKEKVDGYFSVSCRCVAAAVTTLAVIWIFKLCWGRIRFRQLEDLADFTRWYIPRGFNGYFSFPSGHTANGTVICAVSYYFRFMPSKYEKIKPFLCFLLGLWVVLLAYSRVRIGAHYLSDVLFGGAITFAIVYFLRPLTKE